MKKFAIFLGLLFATLSAGMASASLYDYYTEQGLKLPSVDDRRPEATLCGIVPYWGSKSQNLALEACLRGEMMLGANPLPSDNYDSFITSPLSASASTTYVNALPSGVSSSIYTIFASDGTTPREKIYCSGTASSPNRLTGCIRGVSFSPVSGVITEDAGTGLSHSKNARIAITDNINFSGKALAILNGSQETGADNFLVGTTSTFGVKINAGGQYIYAFNNGTNPYIRFNSSTVKWQWSEDGTNYYNFASSTVSQLSASSTMATKITGSELGVIVSSSMGMYDGADGNGIYQKASSTMGILQDTNGMYLDSSYVVLDSDTTTTPTDAKIPIQNSNKLVWTTTAPATGTTAYFDGTNWVNLGAGQNGQYLKQGASVPSWSAINDVIVSSSTITLDQNYQNQSSSTLAITVGFTITDGDASGDRGRVYIKVSNTSTPSYVMGGLGIIHDATTADRTVNLTTSFFVPPYYYYRIDTDNVNGSATMNYFTSYKL